MGGVGYTPTVFCLVTGAPRSGTTAVGEWLEHHDEVTTFAETRILVVAHAMIREVERFRRLSMDDFSLRRAVRRLVFGYYAEHCDYAGRRVLVDKEPLEPIALPDREYAGFLNSVSVVEPDTKFLIMVRDPVSTVWSMTQRKWGYSLANEEPRTFSIDEHIANWCACADIALARATDPNSYVCPYGRLVTKPAEESARIAEFLGLSGVEPFQPRSSSETGFSAEEEARIETATQSRVEALAAAGLTNL